MLITGRNVIVNMPIEVLTAYKCDGGGDNTEQKWLFCMSLLIDNNVFSVEKRKKLCIFISVYCFRIRIYCPWPNRSIIEQRCICNCVHL